MALSISQRKSSGGCSVERQHQRRCFCLSAPSRCSSDRSSAHRWARCQRQAVCCTAHMHAGPCPSKCNRFARVHPSAALPSEAKHVSWTHTHLRASIEAGLGACRHKCVVRDCGGRHALPPHATPHLKRPAGGRWVTGRGQDQAGMGACNCSGTVLLTEVRGDAPEAALTRSTLVQQHAWVCSPVHLACPLAG